jgi:hypothetical protein
MENNLHEELKATFLYYCKEVELFEDKGIKAAAPRARKALLDMTKLIKERRKEIQERKSSM